MDTFLQELGKLIPASHTAAHEALASLISSYVYSAPELQVNLWMDGYHGVLIPFVACNNKEPAPQWCRDVQALWNRHVPHAVHNNNDNNATQKKKKRLVVDHSKPAAMSSDGIPITTWKVAGVPAADEAAGP